MSGRLTPAAATLTSTSPAPGRGTGRSTTDQLLLGGHDGLHGCGWAGPRPRRLLTWAPRRCESSPIDIDELFPSKPDDPLVALEPARTSTRCRSRSCTSRIEALKAEIARVEAHIDAVTSSSAAEQLFKR